MALSFNNMNFLGFSFLHAQDIWPQDVQVGKKGFFCYSTYSINVPGYNFHYFRF